MPRLSWQGAPAFVIIKSRLSIDPTQLYIPGPDETLMNYEVHLRNNHHRQLVNDRIQVSGVTQVAAAAPDG